MAGLRRGLSGVSAMTLLARIVLMDVLTIGGLV